MALDVPSDPAGGARVNPEKAAAKKAKAVIRREMGKKELPSGPLPDPKCYSFIGVLYRLCRSIAGSGERQNADGPRIAASGHSESRSDEFGIKGEHILCYDKPKI
ncbi:MAG: hypothetical protein ABI604_17095 [Nitrospirota bacterium]